MYCMAAVSPRSTAELSPRYFLALVRFICLDLAVNWYEYKEINCIPEYKSTRALRKLISVAKLILHTGIFPDAKQHEELTATLEAFLCAVCCGKPGFYRTLFLCTAVAS